MRADKRNRRAGTGRRMGNRIKWRYMPTWLGYLEFPLDPQQPSIVIHSMTRQLGLDNKGNAYAADPKVREVNPINMCCFVTTTDDKETARAQLLEMAKRIQDEATGEPWYAPAGIVRSSGPDAGKVYAPPR